MLLAKCRAVSVVVSWVRSKMGIKKSKKPHKTSLERNPSKESICEQGPAFRRKTTRGRSVTEKWGHGSNIIFMTMQGFMRFVLSGSFTLNIHLGDIARYTSWVVLFLSVKAESQGASHARSEERTFQAEGTATEQALRSELGIARQLCLEHSICWVDSGDGVRVNKDAAMQAL